MTIKAWGLILVCLLFGSFSVGAVAAQDEDCPDFTESIEYGDEARGEINDDAVFIFYCFQGERGDELVIDLETTDGDLDPYLLLSDITVEEFYAENDNASDRDENSHIEYTLEDDATYIITATRFDGNKGRTEGEFSLRLESGSSSSSSSSSSRGVDGGQCTPGSNLLLPGYELESSINDDNYLRSYCFYGVAGVEYRMTVETLSDDLDPLVFVTTPDLTDIIDSNDNVNSRSTDARLDFVPEEDGVYLIGVTRVDLDGGDTSGDFLVSLENRDTGDPEACPDALRFPEAGVEIPRAEETYLYVYCFNGEENDDVTFRAEAQRGDLDMAAFITAPNLDTVAQDESKDDTFEFSATIPEDGPYLVIVFDLTGLGRIDMTLEGGSSSGNSSSGNNSTIDDIGSNTNNNSNNSGDCDEEPLSFLVEGNWSSTSSTGTMEMKFDCEGTVNVTVNGNSFEAPYIFEDETLTLELDDGDLVVEGVLLTRTALIGTSDGQAFMLLNRAR